MLKLFFRLFSRWFDVWLCMCCACVYQLFDFRIVISCLTWKRGEYRMNEMNHKIIVRTLNLCVRRKRRFQWRARQETPRNPYGSVKLKRIEEKIKKSNAPKQTKVRFGQKLACVLNSICFLRAVIIRYRFHVKYFVFHFYFIININHRIIWSVKKCELN